MEIIVTDEMKKWYEDLMEAEQEAVYESVGLLEQFGVKLGFPHSSEIKNTKYAFRELRAPANKSELRIIYAFDPSRDAILIIGGDKSGDSGFYKKIIRKAENIWKEYLQEYNSN